MISIVYDAVILNKVLYASSGWGRFISHAHKDHVDVSSSFQKHVDGS